MNLLQKANVARYEGRHVDANIFLFLLGVRGDSPTSPHLGGENPTTAFKSPSVGILRDTQLKRHALKQSHNPWGERGNDE